METSSQAKDSSLDVGSMMKRHPLLFYFLLAYAISWILLIPYVLSNWSLLPNEVTFTLVAPTLATYGPTLSALIMTNVVEGREGRALLRQHLRQRNAGLQWWLFILLGIPALIILGVIVQPGTIASFKGITTMLPVVYMLNFFGVFFGGGPLGEEIGWRGFALPRMQPRYGPLQSTLILGSLWCFWHLPRFLTPEKGGGPGTSLTSLISNLTLFFFFVMALAVIFTWIFNHTGGSIFFALIAHTSVNTPELVFVPPFLALDYTSVSLAYLIGFGVPALLVLIFTRGRLSYKQVTKT